MSDQQAPNPPPQSPPTRGWNTLVSHVSAHKLDCGLWATRLATVVFALGYFLPIFGGDPRTAYYKALVIIAQHILVSSSLILILVVSQAANAATSALRLHQRLPAVRLNREFLALLLSEDSAHYLFFSLIFLFASPVTVALLPAALFAFLHAASYSLTLLDALGQNSWWGARMLISLVELQSRNILRMAAFSEIFLLPLSLVLVFTGRTPLLTPFVYYRFLGLRYASRRNPYCRTMFHELRLAVEEAASSPKMPQGVRNLLFKAVNFVSGMAPAVFPAQQ